MSKQNIQIGIAIVVAIAVVSYFFLTNVINTEKATMSQDQQNIADQNGVQNSDQPTGTLPTPPPNGVLVQDVTVGTGTEATKGSLVSVEYVGKLQDGTTFDQSASHGGPYQFTLGAGQVIPGWERGIEGMKVGGERVLIIPPALGYGAQQVATIPANSTLIFDVKLVGVGTSTPAKK